MKLSRRGLLGLAAAVAVSPIAARVAGDEPEFEAAALPDQTPARRPSRMECNNGAVRLVSPDGSAIFHSDLAYFEIAA